VFTFLFFSISENLVFLYLPDFLDRYRIVVKTASLWGMVVVAAYTVYSGYRFASQNWHILNLEKSI
jgi:hypothetical protein